LPLLPPKWWKKWGKRLVRRILLTGRKVIVDNGLQFGEPSSVEGCLIGMGDALKKASKVKT
jgi:hypothetical protein